MHHRRHHPATNQILASGDLLAVQRSIWQICRSGYQAGRRACQSSRVVRQHCAAYACVTSLPTQPSFSCTRDRRVASTRVPSSLSAAPASQADRSGWHSVLRNGETAAQSNDHRRSRSTAWCRLLVLGVALSLGRRASHPAWLFHAAPRRSEAGADYAGSARCLLHTPRCRWDHENAPASA